MGELVPAFNMYCRDFAGKFADVLVETMKEYGRQLVKANLGVVDLRRGIERVPGRAHENPFTPNPVEFVEMCRPSAEELGLPSFDECYDEVWRCIDVFRRDHPGEDYPFKHRLSRFVVRDIGTDFSSATSERRRAMVSKSYQKYLRVAQVEGNLPEIHEAIADFTDPEPLCFQYERKFGRPDPNSPLMREIARIRESAKEAKHTTKRSQ